VLAAAAERCDGPIAEFGCGDGSTLLLHEIAQRRGVRLVSLDTNEQWLARFRGALQSPLHEFRLVTAWDDELARPEWGDDWGLVFVDQAPWEARAATVRRVRENSEFVVVHDCDYLPRHGLFGRMLRDVSGPSDHGERDYSDVFTSWREFFPPEPWPLPETGPPTLLGSNRRDVGQVPVDFDKHLPLWWRVGRHARGWVPQSLRMRIATRIGWRAPSRL
jgi:hypothetical protein